MKFTAKYQGKEEVYDVANETAAIKQVIHDLLDSYEPDVFKVVLIEHTEEGDKTKEFNIITRSRYNQFKRIIKI